MFHGTFRENPPHNQGFWQQLLKPLYFSGRTGYYSSALTPWILLWEDVEAEDDGQEDGGGLTGGSGGAWGADEARLVGGDLAVDPGLVLGHSGVDSWEFSLSTADSKADHSGLDPPGAIFNHHGAARVALHTTNIMYVTQLSEWMKH